MKKLLLCLVALGLIFLIGCSGSYNAFATCLTEKGVKMYGADWCPHCKTQKAQFGKSFENINYIECAISGGKGQRDICNLAGITIYPTWEFFDGTQITGVQSLEKLSKETGCSLEG